MTVQEIGPAESHADSLWWLDERTAVREIVPGDDLLFLAELSIEPVLAGLTAVEVG